DRSPDGVPPGRRVTNQRTIVPAARRLPRPEIGQSEGRPYTLPRPFRPDSRPTVCTRHDGFRPRGGCASARRQGASLLRRRATGGLDGGGSDAVYPDGVAELLRGDHVALRAGRLVGKADAGSRVAAVSRGKCPGVVSRAARAGPAAVRALRGEY